jgi:hypothetical protein
VNTLFLTSANGSTTIRTPMRWRICFGICKQISALFLPSSRSQFVGT